MNRGTLIAAIVCGSMAAGCGAPIADRGTSASEDGTRSPVVLFAPPKLRDSGAHTPQESWSIDADTGELRVSNTSVGVDATFAVPDAARVLAVDVWQDTTLPIPDRFASWSLVVSAIDADERFMLHRYRDTDDDGMIDASSHQLLLAQPPGAKGYVTSFVRTLEGTHVYLLDRRCQDIWVATDTSGDGLPDELAAAPFAQSAVEPDLHFVHQLVVAGPGRLVTLLQEDSFPWSARSHAFQALPRLDLLDSDLDGLVDAVSTITSNDGPTVPLVKGMPFDGQTSISVKGTVGEVAEIWRLNVQGDLDSLLGSKTLQTSDWEAVQITALAHGEQVGARYASSDPGVKHRLSVWTDGPQILDLSSALVSQGGGTLSLHGLNLVATMSVTLQASDADHPTYSIPFTLSSSEGATLSIPPLPASAIGTALIGVRGAGQPEEHGADAMVVTVCE